MVRQAEPQVLLAARPKSGGEPPGKKDPKRLRQQIEALDAQFLHRPRVSEKILLQEEMGYMRRLLSDARTKVDVTYPVNPPYAFIQIRFEESSGEFRYLVREPTLKDGEPEKLALIRKKMETLLDQGELPPMDLAHAGASPELERYLHEKFLDALDLYDIEVPKPRRAPLFYYLKRELVGLGRMDAVMHDPFVEDVSCNGAGIPLYVFHRVFGSVQTSVQWESDMELNRYALKLAQMSGKHVSIYQPILDATLQDGSRLNLTLGTEVTRKGSTFSIRRFTQDPISPIDLVRYRSLSAHEAAYFWELLAHKRSILISGGTASGKTTLLNALSMFMRPEDKIVSIEDTPEVHLAHSNWIQSVSRAGYGMGGKKDGSPGSITLFDLLVAALRQRPEYVLVGEVRGKEAFTLFQAISTGHAAMATIHAANMEELLHRIENEPMNIPRVLLQALDAVAFPGQVAFRKSRARRVRGITEILEVDNTTGNLLTNDIFTWNPADDIHHYSGRSFVLEKIARAAGYGLDDIEAELERKTRYIQALTDLGMTHFRDVTRAINDYYNDGEGALATVEGRVQARQNGHGPGTGYGRVGHP